MHDFMRAIGFSRIKNKKEYQEILCNILEEPTEVFMSPCSVQSAFGGMGKEYADRMGMMAFGDFNEEADLEPEFYFPYLKGRQTTFTDYVSIEKQADKESYMGVCDDVNVGVSVIFQLINMKDYMEYCVKHEKLLRPVCVSLSGLSVSGKIILPVMKDEDHKERRRMEKNHRNQMLAAARQGDQDAIESLTLEDIDLYTVISRRAKTEDVLTIVESYFMPYGISCDQYSVLGTILEVDTLVNSVTGEELYRLSLECNDLVFDVCINSEDLMGEPAVGRRFRGNIWLQGVVDFGEKGL